MAFGFARPPQDPLPDSADSTARLGRLLEPAEWASAGIPLLRNPRDVVADLSGLHLPGPSGVIVAVLDGQERVVASASFTAPTVAPDGWAYRNALLAQLRRVIPHDLRLRVPARTAVLLHCREDGLRWTEADGAWMWGLRDACTLHGLRCGAFIALTRDHWQVLGEGRGGRRPGAPTPGRPRAADAVRTGPGRGARGRTGAAALGDVTPPAATPPREVRPPAGPAAPEEVPAGPGQSASPRLPSARSAAPGEQSHNGGRGASTRTAGGAAEARRSRAAR
ncbi:hypothetical protein GCM10009864_61620 [Streptomyces lunalinharesii]|uniref:Uncharacterized protein n=1 Tax=Streptomyces lunalinharesii TaxID=333384 RepID=A0ABN3SM38_9ACTN